MPFGQNGEGQGGVSGGLFFLNSGEFPALILPLERDDGH